MRRFPGMGGIVDDVTAGAEWILQALTGSGYTADFTPESLGEIDRFFDEHVQGGEPLPGGLLAEDLGTRIFALGAYTGGHPAQRGRRMVRR